MEENKQEEQTTGNEHQAKDESISSKETITDAEQPETNNQQPATENMEVHHHSHAHGKKSWKEYFFEFFMLFLAVFCGFLAEYQLEHKIEKDRAKQYVVSFYEDLVTDTTRLNGMLLYDDDKITALDNMADCYDTVSINPFSSECMTKLILHSRANRAFSITERTITQLVNAGGFRLMKKEDADSILGYINTFKEYQDFQSTVFQESQDNVRNTLNELVAFKSAESLLKPPMPSSGTTSSNISAEMVSHGPLLFANNPILLNKWFNQLSVYLRITKRQRQQLADLNQKANGLVLYLKNKYQLK